MKVAQPSLDIYENGIRIRDLDVPRHSVAEFLRGSPDDARVDRLVEVIEVGTFCLERASAARDIDFVRHQIDAVIRSVGGAVRSLPTELESAVVAKIGSDDGQVLAPVRGLVDRASESVNHVMRQTRIPLPEVDEELIRAQVARARTALARIGTINRSVTQIRTGAASVENEAESLRSEIRRALTAIEDALQFGDDAQLAQAREVAGGMIEVDGREDRIWNAATECDAGAVARGREGEKVTSVFRWRAGRTGRPPHRGSRRGRTAA